ncbi:MAG TPA: cytochrome P450 [Acidimicrobiales bacterium]|nr:cytochrome P450 [Acidimicrobiales bacterium]
MSRSLLFGDARDLQRDQLGTYERAMAASGDLFRFRVGPPRVGFQFDAVFRPEGAHEVLASKASRYVKEAPVYSELARLLGPGLITTDGDLWRRDRRILQPVFTRPRVTSYVDVISAGAADLVSWWATANSGGGVDGHVVDLHADAMRYALHVLSHTLFGDDVGSAGPVIRDALPVLSAHATRRGLSPMPSPAWWPSPANRRAERLRRALWEMVDDLVVQRRDRDSEHDLLSLLLTARDPDTGAALDDAAVRAHALTILLAGHETTGSSLAFTLHLLARHQSVQDRVRQEVTQVLGGGGITADNLEELHYTAQVVDEALRLYPPAHTLVRQAADDSTLCGHSIPGGRIVAVSVWGIHHNPSVWPDPHRFDPDRFDGAPERSSGDRYTHLPFGGGPHACIGRFLAIAELLAAVATVVRDCRLQSLVETPALDAGLTLRPAGTLPCRVQRLARRG